MAIFIFLSTTNIGGAERRFIGLWHALVSSGHSRVKLVVTPQLYEIVTRIDEYREYEDAIVQFTQSFHSLPTYRKAVKDTVDRFVKKGDVVHFIGDYPLLLCHGINTVYSITQSSLKNMNFLGKVSHYAGALLSGKIDILDPGIYALFTKVFFYKRKKITQTSNSFSDPVVFYPAAWNEKKDWLVFLGRFEPGKQVLRFAEALPALYAALKNKTPRDFHVFFLGHGSQEETLRNLLASPSYTEIPVTVRFEENPETVLNQSKLFFSLQLHNNYPSKSLLEAMASGNLPIVTDVGQTRLIAEPDYSEYVPEHFSTEDIVNAVVNCYNRTEEEWQNRSARARKLVVAEHTIEKMTAYYVSIYNARQ